MLSRSFSQEQQLGYLASAIINGVIGRRSAANPLCSKISLLLSGLKRGLAQVELREESLKEISSFRVHVDSINDALSRWLAAIDPNEPDTFNQSLIPKEELSEPLSCASCFQSGRSMFRCSSFDGSLQRHP